MATERVDYTGEGLSEAELLPTPWQQTRAWVDAAVDRSHREADVKEPLALSVATVDADGHPDVRTVLTRFLDTRGPGFVTCLTSTKAQQIAANPAVAASLTWQAMYRAVRFRGTAELVDREEVLGYFQERPWGSRISAWTSRQSEPAASRAALEEAYAAYADRWPDQGNADDVPLPDFWGGYRVLCDSVEFWGGRSNRLHDRFRFSRVGPGDLDDEAAWTVQRLQP